MPARYPIDSAPRHLGLFWLIRLRWMAIAGQTAICLVAAFFLHLPLAILGACIAFTIISNLILSLDPRLARGQASWLIPSVIVSDIVVLTIMLYFAGGPHNPFTSIYILHITIAAILLPTWAAWSALALCGVGFTLLFLSPHTVLASANGTSHHGDMTAHLQGMVVAMLVTGAGVAYFVIRLSANLEAHRVGLAKARELGHREKRFASLATLAAGVAHELATPLGTIAVVSKDFETLSCPTCGSVDRLADAQLIRQEVERCRAVLHRLAEQANQRDSDQIETVVLRDIPVLLREYLPESVSGRLRSSTTPESASFALPLAPLLRSLSVLVKNACEASPAEAPIDLTVEADRDSLRFRVQDEGIGIAEENIERLGEPFYSTKSAGVGMGLGLFLVRTFVDRMQGEWKVQSRVGSGTTVEMLIPRASLEP